jgi:hypothetical protein
VKKSTVVKDDVKDDGILNLFENHPFINRPPVFPDWRFIPQYIKFIPCGKRKDGEAIWN